MKYDTEKEKNLRRIYREMHQSWNEFKQANQNAADLMSDRKHNEERNRRERAHEMMAKLQRSQKAVEAFMKDQAHKNMLAQEQRKLHDHDMKKVHERAKRLATRKKMEILGKEIKDKSLVDEVRRRQERLVDIRYNNRMKNIESVEKYNRSLDDWGKKGFLTSTLNRDSVELMNTLES